MPVRNMYSQRLESYLAKGLSPEEAHNKASNDAAVKAVRKVLKKPSKAELLWHGKNWYEKKGKYRKDKNG